MSSSTLVISSILYFNLSHSLTAEFEDRVKAECGEVMQVLTNRFHQTDNRVRELCQDNTIRVTLMLGVTQQLQEYFSKKYGIKKDTYFFIAPLNSEHIFNASGLDMVKGSLNKLMASPAGIGRLERVEQYGFIYFLSRPVFRQKNKIGTALGIYILNNDKTLLRFITQNKNSSIIKMEKGEPRDLLTGKIIKGLFPLIKKIKKQTLSYGILDNEKIVAVQKKQFPNLIYISKLDRLHKAKTRVLTLVLFSSIAVLVFTIIISLFLSRLLGAPLSKLSKQSLDMVDGKSDMTCNTIFSNVIEVEQLMSSLTAMVKSLKKTEELKRYQQLFEGVTDPVFICDFSGNFLQVNQIAIDQFGFTRKEFERMGLTDMVPAKHHKKIFSVLKDLSQKGSRIVFEIEISRNDKKFIYIECHARKIFFKDQEAVLSVARDITDRKKAQKDLIRSEERLSLALEVSLAGAWELDLGNGKFSVDANQFKSLGYSRKEQPKRLRDILKIIDPESVDNAKTRFDEFLQGKIKDYSDEFKVLARSGEKRWMHNRARVVKFDRDHKPMVVIGTAIDISDLKRVEQALLDNEERYRTILDNRNIGYFEVDLDGNLTFFNDALCDLMEYSPDELMGVNYKFYTDRQTSKRIESRYTDIIETGRPLKIFEYPVLKKSGASLFVETSVSLIKDPKDQAIGFRGLIIDITDRKLAEKEKKKLESELRQAHKMEAIGTLAGGIAHDFNNILSGILGYSQLAEMNIENPVKTKGHIRQIQKGAKRAAGLIQQILTFSRQTEHEKHLLNISIVVKEALKLLRSSIPSSIEIKENIFSDAVVLADPTQIHQVIMNLCTNAYHAMRTRGGILTVGLNEITISDQESIPDLNILSGKYLKLDISDTGHGMDKETLGKIFDPYFSTKEVGEGTGLGLALVYGIVEDHGGYVKASSVPGKGSQFHVFFPIKEKKGVSPVQTDDDPPLTGGSERIMVVDDEESILISTRELLSDYGYKVTAFSKSPRAFEEFKQDPDKFDLIITDMTMPQMTGDELSVKILKTRKDMPIILCTGYNENISESKALELGIKKYIQKPIDSRLLIQLIQEVLDG
ncbi:MAG: PAS domain S-box protein [Deltaproteobacteria bacterium]|nr:PAS domain S-box protein [Deltaproteobacteria bacterium]